MHDRNKLVIFNKKNKSSSLLKWMDQKIFGAFKYFVLQLIIANSHDIKFTP
jgi:hypothetical protein